MNDGLNPEEVVIFASIVRTNLEKSSEIIDAIKAYPNVEIIEKKMSIGKIYVKNAKPLEQDAESIDSANFVSTDEHVTLAVIIKTKLINIKPIKDMLETFEETKVIYKKSAYEMLYLHVEKYKESPVLEL